MFCYFIQIQEKSYAKLALDVLERIVESINSLKNEPAKIIFSGWWISESDTIRKVVFDNYHDYKKINAFYDVLQDEITTFPNIMLPLIYLGLALEAAKGITWRKFYKLDYVLVIPLVIITSCIITILCEAIPYLCLLTALYQIILRLS
jgi:hypothetical protein